MLLGKPKIEEYIKSGDIVCDPFVPENLGSAQYDVTIGENIYREVSNVGSLYNPFDEKQVRGKWQLDKAISHADWYELIFQLLDAIPVWTFLVLMGGILAVRVGKVRS